MELDGFCAGQTAAVAGARGSSEAISKRSAGLGTDVFDPEPIPDGQWRFADAKWSEGQ